MKVCASLLAVVACWIAATLATVSFAGTDGASADQTRKQEIPQSSPSLKNLSKKSKKKTVKKAMKKLSESKSKGEDVKSEVKPAQTPPPQNAQPLPLVPLTPFAPDNP